MIKVFSNKTEKEISNFWNHMVFHPTNAIEDDWGREQLDALAAERAIGIVRIYTMFEESVTLDKNGQMQFDFTRNDLRIDYLLKKGFTPYIAYAFFPPFLSSETDPALRGHRYKGTIICRSFPNDYEKWGEICRQYTLHIVDRYGEETVAKWYLHCYNEPDLLHFFYKNAPDYQHRAEAYCKMYESFVKGVTAVSSKLKIGGVALSESPTHLEFLEYFLNYVREKKLKLDFISYHSYGTSPEGMIDGTNPLDVDGSIYNTMQIKRVAKICGFENVPTVCDEWGACTEGYLGTDKHSGFIFRENEIYAAYFAKMLTHYDEIGLNDPMLICMSGAHDLKTDFGGHRNFFTKHFYPKPIFNAYVLAAKLGNRKLFHYADLDCEDISVFPTIHDDGHISILLCYADNLFVRPLKPIAVDLVFDGISEECQVTGWRIDADHANAIRKYKELGKPADPTEQQKKEIRQFGALKPENLGVISAENPTITIDMENNTTLLVEVTKN